MHALSDDIMLASLLLHHLSLGELKFSNPFGFWNSNWQHYFSALQSKLLFNIHFNITQLFNLFIGNLQVSSKLDTHLRNQQLISFLL